MFVIYGWSFWEGCSVGLLSADLNLTQSSLQYNYDWVRCSFAGVFE